MRGRKKSLGPLKTETITVRLTEEEKQELSKLAIEFGIPKSQIISSLIEGRKMLFISFIPLDKSTHGNYKLARSLKDAIESVKVIKETGGEINFIGWVVKINSQKFAALKASL